MKAVILAGGRGTRISEESQTRPKPMVEIGGRPILWHIMKIYGAAGITDFVILLGYKGYMIKEYFANYFLHTSDVTIDLASDTIKTLQSNTEPWSVTLLDTGVDTMTGGRLLRAKDHIGDETFSFTYGDGVTDLDIRKVVEFHRKSGSIATVTAVQPPGRYGTLDLDDGDRASFAEKPHGSSGWVNGGFFVAVAVDTRLHRRRRHRIRANPVEPSLGRRRAVGLPTSGILARNGHPLGQDQPGRHVEQRQGALEDLV